MADERAGDELFERVAADQPRSLENCRGKVFDETLVTLLSRRRSQFLRRESRVPRIPQLDGFM